MDVPALFRDALFRDGLVRPGDRVLAAVSGGSDSIALLHLLHAAGTAPLAVAHFDHALREDSREDALFAARHASRLRLPFFLARRDAGDPGTSEAALRRARFLFLEATARSWGATRIALGHTRDDQAETVVLHLIRGAGGRGLGAMRPMRRGAGATYIRPLLRVTRQALRSWLAAEKLAWRDDPSNADPRFLRNRVRLEVLPLLESLRPGAAGALARAADLARHDDALLERLARRALSNPARGVSPRRLALLLAGLPPALARRVLRREAARLLPGLSPAARRVEAALDRVRGGNPGRVDLGRGLVLELEAGGSVRLASSPRHAARALRSVPLPVPGDIAWPEGALRVAAQRLRTDTAPPARGPEEVDLDETTLSRGLVVRSRRPGDRFRPAGGIGSRKVSTFLADLKIPRLARAGIPILCCGDDVVWIAGYRADARFVAPPGCRAVVRVRVVR